MRRVVPGAPLSVQAELNIRNDAVMSQIIVQLHRGPIFAGAVRPRLPGLGDPPAAPGQDDQDDDDEDPQDHTNGGRRNGQGDDGGSSDDEGNVSNGETNNLSELDGGTSIFEG